MSSPFHVDTVGSFDQVAKAGCYLDITDSGGLVDTGAEIEGEGRLVICDHCLKGLIELIPGVVLSEDAERLEAALSEAAERIVGLSAALADRNDVIAAQNRLLRSLEVVPSKVCDELPFGCTECPEAFPTEHGLRGHFGKQHKGVPFPEDVVVAMKPLVAPVAVTA